MGKQLIVISTTTTITNTNMIITIPLFLDIITLLFQLILEDLSLH
jgi:hypothetical protein